MVGKGQDIDVALSSDPGPVDVVFQMGSREFCMSFGGDTKFKTNVLFKGKGAAAPMACP